MLNRFWQITADCREVQIAPPEKATLLESGCSVKAGMTTTFHDAYGHTQSDGLCILLASASPCRYPFGVTARSNTSATSWAARSPGIRYRPTARMQDKKHELGATLGQFDTLSTPQRRFGSPETTRGDYSTRSRSRYPTGEANGTDVAKKRLFAISCHNPIMRTPMSWRIFMGDTKPHPPAIPACDGSLPVCTLRPLCLNSSSRTSR
jgi:hypothetical protein